MSVPPMFSSLSRASHFRLETVEVSAVLKGLDDFNARGRPHDSRIRDALCMFNARPFFLEIPDVGEFHRLVWHAIDESRILTPGANPQRMLTDVYGRLIEMDPDFDRLDRTPCPCGAPPEQMYSHSYFQAIYRIYRGFNYEELGWITVTDSGCPETNANPQGTFCVYDGNRRTLALAMHTVARPSFYKPATFLYLTPRPLK